MSRGRQKNKDKDRINLIKGNPGQLIGRSISFAKYTHEQGLILHRNMKPEEPCWEDKKGVLIASFDVYQNFLNWLKNR